jgi:hypothetical protein
MKAFLAFPWVNGAVSGEEESKGASIKKVLDSGGQEVEKTSMMALQVSHIYSPNFS